MLQIFTSFLTLMFHKAV